MCRGLSKPQVQSAYSERPVAETLIDLWNLASGLRVSTQNVVGMQQILPSVRDGHENDKRFAGPVSDERVYRRS